jgi:hypothetical protein
MGLGEENHLGKAGQFTITIDRDNRHGGHLTYDVFWATDVPVGGEDVQFGTNGVGQSSRRQIFRGPVHQQLMRSCAHVLSILSPHYLPITPLLFQAISLHPSMNNDCLIHEAT